MEQYVEHNFGYLPKPLQSDYIAQETTVDMPDYSFLASRFPSGMNVEKIFSIKYEYTKPFVTRRLKMQSLSPKYDTTVYTLFKTIDPTQLFLCLDGQIPLNRTALATFPSTHLRSPAFIGSIGPKEANVVHDGLHPNLRIMLSYYATLGHARYIKSDGCIGCEPWHTYDSIVGNTNVTIYRPDHVALGHVIFYRIPNQSVELLHRVQNINNYTDDLVTRQLLMPMLDTPMRLDPFTIQ